MRVIELSDSDIREVMGLLQGTKSGVVHSIKLAVSGDSVMVKVNHGCWTSTLGHLDPACDAAYYERQAAAEAAADVVVSDPKMLADALDNTRQLNES